MPRVSVSCPRRRQQDSASNAEFRVLGFLEER